MYQLRIVVVQLDYQIQQIIHGILVVLVRSLKQDQKFLKDSQQVSIVRWNGWAMRKLLDMFLFHILIKLILGQIQNQLLLLSMIVILSSVLVQQITVLTLLHLDVCLQVNLTVIQERCITALVLVQQLIHSIDFQYRLKQLLRILLHIVQIKQQLLAIRLGHYLLDIIIHHILMKLDMESLSV